MGLQGPPPKSTNPLKLLATDWRAERAVPRGGWPPGETSFSIGRTRRFAANPLKELVDAYARYGPVFTLRIFHGNSVFMLGPAANHYMTVSHASNFSWREGHMGDLIPMLGDGLLTIDGDFHRRSRRIMLPAFHSDRVAATIATMLEEIDAELATFADATVIDLYHRTRRLALRIAMRALFGFDPDAAAARLDMAQRFEQALAFYSRDYWLQVIRGPGTPFARMRSACRDLDRIIYDEIARRRSRGPGGGEDILGLLLGAQDEDGGRLSAKQIRDEVMTLLFAGHDTTTSTVAFMFYELARRPDIAEALREEQERVLGDGPPTAAALMGGSMPLLEMVMDETLRLYPPAWVGARRCVEAFEFAGATVPAGAPVNYSSWASHHLPDVFDDPEQFRPQRFAPEAKAALPKGAYVPFGGGSRICIGMRFGQLEVKAIATRLLAGFEFAPQPGYSLRIRQMPTIGPRDGMRLIVRRRPRAGRRPTRLAA